MNEIDWSSTRVTVTGGAGFLGRVVCDRLRTLGAESVDIPRRTEYDLTHESDVERMYKAFAPDLVIHLAAEVGGIGANRDHPGRFFYANTAMGLHLIEHARRRDIRKFVQVGTVCSYPKHTDVPFREEELFNGYPEATNAPYGVAKRSLAVMLDAYRREYDLASAYLLPANLYGPHDNFDPQTSHVIPALIRKCCAAVDAGARSISCWGTGSASREFLYVDDAADAVVRAAAVIDEPSPINLGTGREVTIRELVELVAEYSGYSGQIDWDVAMPDGQPRRCLGIDRAREQLGWTATTDLMEGLRRTIAWYREQTSLREVRFD